MSVSVNAFEGKVVLVVEDNAIIAIAIADSLEEAGARVLGPVSSVAAALQILKNNAVDGALLDINLIGEQSYQVAEVMTGLGRPFVFVSSLTKSQVPEVYRNRLIDKMANLTRVGNLLFEAR